MSIGDGGGASAGGTETGACALCGRPETKRCSQCKSVWYCSRACQSKHWVDHKLNCNQARLSDKVDIISSDKGACGRMKSSSFGLISLVLGHKTSKVLHVPKKFLFPYDEFVKLFNWDKRRLQPCGLINCGNSCFANVVLQCLVCTRPLMAYLLQRNHSRGCLRKQDDWCFLCELEVHIQRASQNFIPFSPINILTQLPNIGGSLGFGRQEDAHEFMRFAIETMQSVCLDELRDQKALDPSINETTLIHYIFGGHLQSQVICTKCNMVSNRYENMMDLMVEIQGEAESLEECLDQFTIMEWLDGENMYKCDGCNDYVKACKRLTVHQAPNILTIALKRFESGRFGKLNKRVAFPENLDLTPYMSQGGDGSDLYTLYAVVVHLDMENASYFGHYICYIKDCYGYWNRVDDCKVVFVEVEEVLAQGAYMLLYSRRTARREPFFNPMEPARKRQLEVGFKSSNLFKATGPISLRCVQLNPSLQEVQIEGKSEDMYLYKDFEDEDIYDSKPSSLGSNEDEGKPSISPRPPEDISSMHSNSVSLSEISSVEVQAIEVKVMPIPKDLGNGGTNGFEPRPFRPRDFEEEKLLPMDDSEPSSLVPQYLEEGKSSISSSLAEGASSVKSMQFKSIPPAKIPSIGAQSAGCREPCISSDADICMGVGTESPSIIEEPFKLSKYTPDDSCSIKNIVLNMAETSSGAFITTSDPMLGPSDHSRPNLLQAVVPSSPSDSADRVHMPDDVSCACKRTRTQASCWENGSRGKSKALFPCGFLDKPPRKKSVGHGVETITGNLELALALAPKVNGYAPGHVEPESLSSNRDDTLPSSDKPSISHGFLNKSDKQTASEDEIAKMESGEVDHPCIANHNGSAEPDSVKPSAHDSDACLEPFSSNGKDILAGFGSSFIPRGFLDKAYKQLKNENKAAEGVHSCKTNCDCAAGLNYGFAEQASASH